MKSVSILVATSLALMQNVNGGLVNILPFDAKFPDGVWDGSSCDAKTLRLLPLKCRQALTADSSDSEKLGCHLIAQPHAPGAIPFGTYPADQRLDVELASLTGDTINQVFDDCALAKMINDGCFNFRRNDMEAGYHVYSYATEEEYKSSTSKTYSDSFDFSFDVVVVSSSVAYSTKNAEQQGSTSLSKSAHSSRTWEKSLGTLTYSTCARGEIVKNYLDKDFVAKWQSIAESAARSPQQILQNKYFEELLRNGFFIPTTFGYAVKYAATLDAEYKESSATSSKSTEETMKETVEVGFLFFSSSVSHEMSKKASQSASEKHVDMSFDSHDYKYGICDFEKMLENGALDWSNVLRDCAHDTLADFLNLDRAAYVPEGGFYNIFEMLRHAGVDIDMNNLAAAMREYYAICECDEPWNTASTTYTCKDGAGNLIKKGIQTQKDVQTQKNVHCSKAMWFNRSPPHFAVTQK